MFIIKSENEVTARMAALFKTSTDKIGMLLKRPGAVIKKDIDLATAKKYAGAYAEVGVFKGASAKLICEVKGEKTLHLFDTFEGLPEASKEDRNIHQKGQYAYGLEDVQQYLSAYDNVQYHKGLFPDSTADVPDQQYAFVHFDVDLYEGTLACLEYFYPKMVHGGVMLSHDYGILAGVEQAFTEFFADKPEEVIELPTTQCLVFKL